MKDNGKCFRVSSDFATMNKKLVKKFRNIGIPMSRLEITRFLPNVMDDEEIFFRMQNNPFVMGEITRRKKKKRRKNEK